MGILDEAVGLAHQVLFKSNNVSFFVVAARLQEAMLKMAPVQRGQGSPEVFLNRRVPRVDHFFVLVFSSYPSGWFGQHLRRLKLYKEVCHRKDADQAIFGPKWHQAPDRHRLFGRHGFPPVWL